MPKVIVFKKQYTITIPRELAGAKGWKKGTVLRFLENVDGSVMLKELK